MDNKLQIKDSRKKGYFSADNEIIDICAKQIGTTALAVYFTLCRHSDKQKESFPSQQSIADKLGISRDTVTDKIAILNKFNLISIDQTKDEKTGKWLHNTYTLLDKTVWRIPPYGEKHHTVSHDTVGCFSYTNNTNNLKIPIEKILENDPLRERKENRAKAAQRRGRRLGMSTKPQYTPSYQKFEKKGGTHAEDIV